ncbi:1-acyl-sn-glycerol-3-phosphate acyltransferase [Rhizobium sp. KVB221]|uniref:1-acyl-sn-glycerol-3-phosphate acyltransferase n=1 Tax=Rhizobium setariae TaxID=2801340 RepID=A0A936YTM5_9HYPH|nr:lysophospholipid acyltransferase family protein [Rhizobium setariae]MBL0374711.1 1-acyl-sn-glycerol-3-phosphate acyltransferase [Rhizobium setariae]
MIHLRSGLFQLAFYVSFIVQMIIFTPIYFFLPRKIAYKIPKNWARVNLWLAEKIIGLTYEIDGLENLPEGGYIISAKHQCFWDTFALIPTLPDPVYILKRELLWIPLFGWYAAKQRMIPINRAAKARAIPEMVARAHEELADGRELIIYPEGTRKAPGDEPDYKFGIARLYTDLKVPVVPIVMHPGLFWQRHSFLRYPGHVKIQILKPIEPGMSATTFFRHLIKVTEKASDDLLMETVRINPHVPLPEVTRIRLEAIRAAGQPAAE